MKTREKNRLVKERDDRDLSWKRAVTGHWDDCSVRDGVVEGYMKADLRL